MAQQVSSVIQQVVAFPTSYAMTVADQHDAGGRAVTFGSLSTYTYFRPYLATASGAAGATATGPTALNAYVRALLNAGSGGGNYWSLPFDANGYLGLRYTGTGTGVVTWDAGGIVRNALGFSGATTSVPSGTTVTAAYPPTHSIQIISRAKDTNWQLVTPRRVIGEVADGTVYGWSDSRIRQKRTFDLRFHPFDWATAVASSAVASPLLGDSSRWFAPQVSASPAITPPWSLSDFFSTCHGYKCAAALSTYPQLVSGATTSFDSVYVAAETLTAERSTTPENANNRSWVGWERVTLIRTGTETL